MDAGAVAGAALRVCRVPAYGPRFRSNLYLPCAPCCTSRQHSSPLRPNELVIMMSVSRSTQVHSARVIVPRSSASPSWARGIVAQMPRVQ